MNSNSLSAGIIQAIKRHPRAVVLSVALHVVLLVLLSLSLSSSEIPEQPKPQANTVKAVVVDAAKFDEEAKRRKQAEQQKVQQALAEQRRKEEEKRKAEQKKKEAEKKRQAEVKRKQEAERKKKAEAERKRKEEQKRLAALELEKKRKQEAEKKRLAEEAEKKRRAEEAEKKRLAEEAEKKRLAEEAEKRRLAEEAELKRRLAEEEQRQAEHNRMLDSLRLQYVRMIEQKVESKWLRPSGLSADQSCEVHVRQTALGDVISVSLQACSSDVAFKNSIERAVWAASPLPPPPNPEVFENEIHFTFRPRS